MRTQTQLGWLRYIDFCYLAKRVGCQVRGFLSMISGANGLLGGGIRGQFGLEISRAYHNTLRGGGSKDKQQTFNCGSMNCD
jgi:hypothetical protein